MPPKLKCQRQAAKHTARHEQQRNHEGQDEAADARVHQFEWGPQELERKLEEAKYERYQGVDCSGAVIWRLI